MIFHGIATERELTARCERDLALHTLISGAILRIDLPSVPENLTPDGSLMSALSVKSPSLCQLG